MAVQVRWSGDAIVVSVIQPEDLRTADAVVEAVLATAPSQALVVDLGSVTLTPATAVEALVRRVQAMAASPPQGRIALVAARLSARQLLQRLGAGPGVLLFPALEPAVLAVAGARPDLRPATSGSA